MGGTEDHGHRGSWEAQGDWGRHRRLRSRLGVQGIVGGTEDHGRHKGSWGPPRIVGGTGGLGEAHKAEIQAGGHRGLSGGTKDHGRLT